MDEKTPRVHILYIRTPGFYLQISWLKTRTAKGVYTETKSKNICKPTDRRQLFRRIVFFLRCRKYETSEESYFIVRLVLHTVVILL